MSRIELAVKVLLIELPVYLFWNKGATAEVRVTNIQNWASLAEQG